MDRQAANKRVVRAYAEAFSVGDFDRVASFFAPGAVVHGVMGRGGLDVALPAWRELAAAFATQIVVEDLVAEGETVAARMTERGQFRAPFRGQAATGQAYEVQAMEWFEFSSGLISRRWGARDFATIARQIGYRLD